jgi:hypothetical protein
MTGRAYDSVLRNKLWHMSLGIGLGLERTEFLKECMGEMLSHPIMPMKALGKACHQFF